MQTGNCFYCRQSGHWINDCPVKLKADEAPPAIHCPCGGGFCEIKVSNTRENPGRKFYKCPAAHTCKFFKWCDKVTDEDIRFRPAFTIPICPCGAGPCRRRVKKVSARAYLTCCIKEGFGACGFFKWEDVEMLQSCDVSDEIDFWMEADQILSDVESSYKAGSDVPMKEGQASVCGLEDDAILENLDSMSVSDLHSTALNQGVPLFDPGLIEPDLIKDTVSSSYVAKHERTNNVQPEAGEAEGSIPYLQDLLDQYNSEKQQLETVSGQHVQVLSEFMASHRRLRLLHEKTSNLRKSLVETEKEMVCCEAETLEFEASCREVASEMAKSQKRMQETAEKLGKEVEVFKQNEFVLKKRRS